MSTFTTRHNSGEERVKNIHRGADLLNNTVVEPGATFSLNDTIGPRTAERGFVVAPVFYGEFTEDVGGGVSQLATTTFNAVFFGGYEDVYHKPHTIYISRYPMGREATVNYPTVDLKFRNDSKAGVLIRTSYSSTSITVTFYGDKEGKVVTEDGRKVLAEYPIEEQLLRLPGTVRARQEQRVRRASPRASDARRSRHRGIDVEFFRVIDATRARNRCASASSGGTRCSRTSTSSGRAHHRRRTAPTSRDPTLRRRRPRRRPPRRRPRAAGRPAPPPAR